MHVLPFADLGFRLNEVQAFWFPMDSRTTAHVIRGRDWMRSTPRPDNNNNNNNKTQNPHGRSKWNTNHPKKGQHREAKLKSLLESARPPDNILSFTQWRFCHMGLILTASSSSSSSTTNNNTDDENNNNNNKNNKGSSTPHLYIIIDLYQTGVRSANFCWLAPRLCRSDSRD